MPLPDERPRQSVANLIGRFEQQTKRQSLTSVPPRSGTPVSQPTGDAPREVKEKREWPPKPKIEKEKDETQKETPAAAATSPDIPTREPTPNKPALPTPDASPKIDPADLHKPSPDVDSSAIDAREDPAPTDAPVSPEPLPAEPVSIASPPRAKVSKPVPARQPHNGSSARTPLTPSKTRGTSSRPSTANDVRSARAPAKSPPTSFHNPPTISASASTPPAQIIRASTSMKNVKASAPRPSSSASVRPPITPARAKTPSVARPKTPASTTRPKTPASGLFAPTAASLARARNAPEAPPMPAKKVTLSADVAERLSKPTASSISKARAAAASPPVPKTPAKRVGAATKATPARGPSTTTKPRGGAPAGNAKDKAAKTDDLPAHEAIPAVVSSEAITELATAPSAEEHMVETVSDISGVAHEPEEQHEDLVPATDIVEPEVPTTEESVVLHHEDSPDVVPSSTEAEVDAPRVETPASDAASGEIAAVDDAIESHIPPDVEDDVDALPESPTPAKDASDLEDIVSMLESGMPAPIKLSVPEEASVAGEIPDEE